MAPLKEQPVIVWFRQDLRLSDNPALSWAAEQGRPIIPLFILEPEALAPAPGGASRWWLHHSLDALDRSLVALGSGLILRHGDAATVLDDLITSTGADTVTWNRRYEPEAIVHDRNLKSSLKGRGISAETFNAALLFEPWTVTTKGTPSRPGGPFRVFSPYWRACLTAAPPPPKPIAAPTALTAPPLGIASDVLADWQLLPRRPDWAGGLRESWVPGETAAQQRLASFLDDGAGRYGDDRDLPGLPDGTSRLSPYLRFGEIGPRQIWHAANTYAAAEPAAAAGVTVLLRELGWREFSYHLLYHFPHITDQPFDSRYAGFGWRSDPDGLEAWQRGQTGYPIVDAGLRQLWHTGWMHNRVRMVVASFLVKDLLVSWRDGAAWFWDTLVDADLANNSASWQWVAGCGADAAPFFRIFNPVTQGEKFDPQGDYVRRWVPELAGLPDKWLHQPWQAPLPELARAGVRLGENYPFPMVDHAAARDRALATLAVLRKER